MKIFFYSTFISSLMTACGSETITSSETPAATDDTILILQAKLEDTYNQLHVFSENEETLTNSIREIHIVPEILADSENDSATICDFMFGIVSVDFDLYSLETYEFEGKVKFFYDATRTKLVTEYTMLNLSPDGILQAFTPDGDLLISRIYKNMFCVSSIVDIYAIDWTFDPASAELKIENFTGYKSTDSDGNTLIKLGESMHPPIQKDPEKPFTNSLYAMREKFVFENVFTVNGQPYTGTLMAYNSPYLFRPNEEITADFELGLIPYFELVFLDGKLHDTIRLYDDNGELQLEEKFENGVLTETVYELDY